MADKRAFFKLDVGYLMNPKVASLRNASSNALVMHVASVAYCAQHLTDGFIPVPLVMALGGGTTDDVALLGAYGMWHLPGHNCQDCPEVGPNQAYVHDFLEHNRSSDDVKKDKDKATKAARARWGTKSDASSIPNGNAEPDANSMPREKERERTTEAKASVPRKRGKRIPDDFAITEEMREWGRTNCPTVDGQQETTKFINYWQAKAGRDATKLDWVATWRNWMLNAKERQPAAKPDATENARRIMQMGRDLQEGALFDGHGANQPALSQGSFGG